MKQPFFSVVIPTKNRSFLIKPAILSVLKQSFSDLEIIVVDNDDTDMTFKTVEGIADPRVRYFRTGGLAMPDNWDLGGRKANGEYILFLEDRQLLKIRSLEKIYAAIKGNDYPPVVSWCCDRILDYKMPVKVVKAGLTGRHFFISSDDVINDFLNYGRRGRMKNVLPRGLNSCIHYSLAEQIRRETGGRLCLSVAPDYTLTFLQLAFIEKLLHIDEAMVTVRGYKYSNGMNFMFKKDTSLRYMGEIGGVSAFYELVPIKSPIIANCLFNDYERIRRLVGERLTKYPINAYTYFFQCYLDIVELKSFDVDVSVEEAEWGKALEEQDRSIRGAMLALKHYMDEKARELLIQRTRAGKFKEMIKEREEKLKFLKKWKVWESMFPWKKDDENKRQRKRTELLEDKIKTRDKRIQKLEEEVKRQRERAALFKKKLTGRNFQD